MKTRILNKETMEITNWDKSQLVKTTQEGVVVLSDGKGTARNASNAFSGTVIIATPNSTPVGHFSNSWSCELFRKIKLPITIEFNN